MAQPITHQNHYVPIWYQKEFLVSPRKKLYYLDRQSFKIQMADGRVIQPSEMTHRALKSCFWSEDLYTTRFGPIVSDAVERYFFGAIDNHGARAVRALARNDTQEIHNLFSQLFHYLNAQKLRTPKGLDWIKSKYPSATQNELMLELDALSQMNSTMWYESVREVVSAEQSDIKFLITDHPVTIYNPACPPGSASCKYPDDPSLESIGTQTIFALGANHCLVLSHLEYARDPARADLKAPRTNPRYYGKTLTRTDAFIRTRNLSRDEVAHINYLLKTRANRFVAASEKEWLYPEKQVAIEWADLGTTLLPPWKELWHFGGEIIVGYKDGSSFYQDEFGRTSGSHKYLKKRRPRRLERGDFCGCGSGKKFRKCCDGVPEQDRPSWDVFSIRERNLMFAHEVKKILGIDTGKTWHDVRKDLSEEQVKEIHEAYSSLWPPDTDISVLLPRPDSNIFRALFFGMVDPRTIPVSVIGWIAYFDEIIVASPFTNASGMRPEYSPTRSPNQYKAQTIKNVLLLLMLEPSIAAGFVHLIPDPADFNESFRQAAWDMGEHRSKGTTVDEEEARVLRELAKDDFRRNMIAMPADALRAMFQKAVPDLNEEQIQELLSYLEAQRVEDPLALLQPMPPGEKGAQLQVMKGYNLEAALFLAGLTGSAVFTDTLMHWRLLHEHTSGAGKQAVPPTLTPLAERVQNIRFVLGANASTGLEFRVKDVFPNIRDAFRRAGDYLDVQRHGVRGKKTAKELGEQFFEAGKSIQKKTRDMKFDVPMYRGRMDLSAPENGFEHNTVRRLQIMFGRSKAARTVSMAMLVNVEPAYDLESRDEPAPGEPGSDQGNTLTDKESGPM